MNDHVPVAFKFAYGKPEGLILTDKKKLMIDTPKPLRRFFISLFTTCLAVVLLMRVTECHSNTLILYYVFVEKANVQRSFYLSAYVLGSA
jgi:hypothetical protein